MSDVVGTYVKYKLKRAEIKARQRAELERELEPLLKEFGEAVREAQSKGKRIEDIEYEIGARNRNLIYNAKRLSSPIPTFDKGNIIPTSPEPTQKPDVDALEVLYGPEDGGHYSVYIDGKMKGSVYLDRDGALELPEDWALDTENQALYREAVKRIRAMI